MAAKSTKSAVAVAAEFHACHCGNVSYVVGDVVLSTYCTSTTNRTFAPGHDAKLKSLLIKAAVQSDDGDVQYQDGGVQISADPITIANRFGFGWMVKNGIAAATVKARVRADKAAVKASKKEDTAVAKSARLALSAAKKAEKAAAPKAAPKPKFPGGGAAKKADVPAFAKVGRYNREGVVKADGSFVYTDAKGVEQVVAMGKYTI